MLYCGITGPELRSLRRDASGRYEVGGFILEGSPWRAHDGADYDVFCVDYPRGSCSPVSGGDWWLVPDGVSAAMWPLVRPEREER